MAQSIQPLRRSILSKFQPLIQYFQIQCQSQNPISCPTRFFSEQPSIQPQIVSFSKAGTLRKSAFEKKLLRLLRNEVQEVLDESPIDKPPSDFHGFEVAEHPGEKRISLSKNFRENEQINIEVTMFDYSIPIPTAGNNSDESGEEDRLHITMIINIVKEESNKVLEFVCSAWPDSLVIEKFFVRGLSKTLSYEPYTGPKFRDLDDPMQDSLHDFLEERGVDDDLCVFLHRYILYKAKAEYVRWMELAQTVIVKK